jgi:hypothetical protein
LIQTCDNDAFRLNPPLLMNFDHHRVENSIAKRNRSFGLSRKHSPMLFSEPGG